MSPVAIQSLLLVVIALATPQITESELQAAMGEGAALVKAQTVEKDFVIVKSSSSYADALASARDAAKRLGFRLDLRALSPRQPEGLSFSPTDCEQSAFEYPCYVARGRGDDGAYVSIEYSTAYVGFRPGLYVVIVASDVKGGKVATNALKAAKKRFKDAYLRRTGVYMGCIH